MTEINRLTALAKDKGCDIVIGIGGGKILDTSKAVAFYSKLPVIICPTIASTDAPCSALSVIYTEEGVFENTCFSCKPIMVLMDTQVIANSPVRLTVSGMGDALPPTLKHVPVLLPTLPPVLEAPLPTRRWHWQNCAMTH